MSNLQWVLICAGLVFLIQPGFMCLESGLIRSKNNINVAVKNLADFGISADNALYKAKKSGRNQVCKIGDNG